MKIDSGKTKKSKKEDKRFQKITDFVVEKSSPQQVMSDDASNEEEAEAIVKFRKAKERMRGKPVYENP